MTKYTIPVPGGYQREAGAAFGLTPMMPMKPPNPATPELSLICACCRLEFAATRTVRPKRCHPCWMGCLRGKACRK